MDAEVHTAGASVRRSSGKGQHDQRASRDGEHMNGSEPYSIDRQSQQEAIFAERELPSYREAEQAMPKCNGCGRGFDWLAELAAESQAMGLYDMDYPPFVRPSKWTPQEAPKPIDVGE